MKKLFLNNLNLDESNMLSNTEKKNLFGGSWVHRCDFCLQLSTQTEINMCLLSCLNGSDDPCPLCPDDEPCPYCE